MLDTYSGTIVEESLIDNRLLNNLKITGLQISTEENPVDRWHIYTVLVTSKDIAILAKNLKPKWYMHFWKGREIIAIFQNKQFQFDYDNKSSWTPAIEYGLSQGIPIEQLDFLID